MVFFGLAAFSNPGLGWWGGVPPKNDNLSCENHRFDDLFVNPGVSPGGGAQDSQKSRRNNDFHKINCRIFGLAAFSNPGRGWWGGVPPKNTTIYLMKIVVSTTFL